MCYIQASVDRYWNDVEILQRREWIYCPNCPLSGPEACRYQDADKTLVYDMGRMHTSSNISNTSSRRGSSIGASSRSCHPGRNSSRREPPAFTGLLMNALMGERRRTHRRSESRTRTSIVTVEGPVPRVYPASIPSPTYRSSYESTTKYSESPMSPRSPMTPGYAGSFDPDIIHASPYDRGRPIIHNENRRSRRSESTEVNTGLSRARTPSPYRPDVRDVRAREERRAQEEARRQRRAELEAREAQLEHVINKERRRQERRREQELRNAEINARIPRPSPMIRQPGILRGSTARPERDSMIEELRDAERGEQVLRQAIADRECREREERQVVADKERHAREAAAETERRRLARRFGRGSERVEYRDDPYRR